jgi:lipopolysaccharide cholinephosphotransferase
MTDTEELRKMYNPDGSELRTLQLKMLDILITVTAVCDKHNIPYWISGGTLLGAVVHKGFIPWDDDIDMEMMRSDYKRLLKVLPGELPPHLYLQTPGDKYYPIPFSKVRDRNSIVYMKDEDTSGYKAKGFFIDIVPVERSFGWTKSILDSLYGRAFRRIKRNNPFASLKRFYEYAIALMLYPAGILLIAVCRSLFVLIKPEKVFYTYGVNAGHGQKIKTIFPLTKTNFEGQLFSSPHNIHEYLFTQYRCDYTQIPPESGRPRHFVKVEYL